MYDAYFGFPESPFRVTPDPRFSYNNSVYQEANAILRYGIEGRKGFTVITGEAGTGKTTMLRKLMRNVEGSIHSVFIFNTYLSFTELLQLILQDLGLSSKESNRAALLQQLNEYLLNELKRGHIVAVLIDEAQNLSSEALEGLRMLSNLETDQEKLIQIVLMGQPELENKLDHPGLRQLKERIALRCRLLPLKCEEVGSYIESRLHDVGFQGPNPFQRDAVQQIAVYSRGIPRLINILCDNALLTAFAASQKVVSRNIIKEVADDLRLTSDRETDGTRLVSARGQSKEDHSREMPAALALYSRAGFKSAVLRTALAGVILAAIASVLMSRGSFGVSGESPTSVKSETSAAETAQIAAPQPEPVKANIESKPKASRIVVQRGTTIEKIAQDAYGANAVLGMDLIRELNPQIKNINLVYPGQDLLLPPLTRETLLRKQPGGSYRLIAACFRKRGDASAYVRKLGEKGYKAVIISDSAEDLILHRVEVTGLKTLQEANRLWETGLKTDLLALAANQSNTAR
jgi:general secretion pathway protein A